MELCVDAKQLEAAHSAMKKAKKNGFGDSLAVFEIVSASPMLIDCRAEFDGLLERAHPSDPSLNWGRHQNVSDHFRCVKGKLRALRPKSYASQFVPQHA